MGSVPGCWGCLVTTVLTWSQIISWWGSGLQTSRHVRQPCQSNWTVAGNGFLMSVWGPIAEIGWPQDCLASAVGGPILVGGVIKIGIIESAPWLSSVHKWLYHLPLFGIVLPSAPLCPGHVHVRLHMINKYVDICLRQGHRRAHGLKRSTETLGKLPSFYCDSFLFDFF